MNDNLRLIDTIIANLDRLTVQGVRNMGLIIDSINALGALRDSLTREDKQDVRTDSE